MINMMEMMMAVSTKEGQALMREAVSEVANGESFAMKTKDDLIVIAMASSNNMGAVAFGGKREHFGSNPQEISNTLKSFMDMGLEMIDSVMEDMQRELEDELIEDSLRSHIEGKEHCEDFCDDYECDCEDCQGKSDMCKDCTGCDCDCDCEKEDNKGHEYDKQVTNKIIVDLSKAKDINVLASIIEAIEKGSM